MLERTWIMHEKVLECGGGEQKVKRAMVVASAVGKVGAKRR